MFKTTGIYKTNESQLDNHYEESGKTKQNQTLYKHAFYLCKSKPYKEPSKLIHVSSAGGSQW